MRAWAKRLATLGAVTPFDYTYQRKGKKSPDKPAVLVATHRAELDAIVKSAIESQSTGKDAYEVFRSQLLAIWTGAYKEINLDIPEAQTGRHCPLPCDEGSGNTRRGPHVCARSHCISTAAQIPRLSMTSARPLQAWRARRA